MLNKQGGYIHQVLSPHMWQGMIHYTMKQKAKKMSSILDFYAHFFPNIEPNNQLQISNYTMT